MAKLHATAAAWVLMGPDPHMAHCERCGATIAKPPFPQPISAFLAYMAGFAAVHANCHAS